MDNKNKRQTKHMFGLPFIFNLFQLYFAAETKKVKKSKFNFYFG
jgi:hypothetical protein